MNRLELILKQKIKNPLTGSEINKALNGRAKIITYKDVLKFENIDELFKPYDAVVLLYLTSENYGHWVALIRHPPTKKYPLGFIEHTDSYGIIPDEELNYAPSGFRKEHNMVKPHLLDLYYGSGLPVEYNDNRLQKMSKEVSTCGRWVILRILFREVPLEKFVKFIKTAKDLGITQDQLVALLTFDV